MCLVLSEPYLLYIYVFSLVWHLLMKHINKLHKKTLFMLYSVSNGSLFEILLFRKYILIYTVIMQYVQRVIPVHSFTKLVLIF